MKLKDTPWKGSYNKLRQHVKNLRHHFASKGPCHQSYGFSSSHVRCERWIIEKVEQRSTDAFELWCWRRILRVPWTSKRSNQAILKEINPEYSLEGLMLKLKPQYFGYRMQRAVSLEKTLMLGNIESGKRSGQLRVRCLDSIAQSEQTLGDGERQGNRAWLQRAGHNKGKYRVFVCF